MGWTALGALLTLVSMLSGYRTSRHRPQPVPEGSAPATGAKRRTRRR